MEVLRESISSLDYKRREVLFKQLSPNERRQVVQILKNRQEIVESEEKTRGIFEKIHNVKSFSINHSKRRDRRSIIALFNRKIGNVLDEIAYFFGFFTAKKTQRLANKYLTISNASSNELGRAVSDTKLREILIEERRKNPRTRINLKDTLEKHGYSSKITDCRFDSAKIFLSVDLKDVTFESCHFEWCHLSNASLIGVTFDGCTLSNISFQNAEMEKCNFHNCKLREVMFTGAKIDSSNLCACSIIGSSFEDASIAGTIFLNSSLPATHFLQATVEDSKFIKCNLKDTVFFGTLDNFSVDEKSKETAVVTAPTTAILVDPETRGITTPKAYMKLDQKAHTIPLRIALKSQKTTSEKVNWEIEKALEEIGSYSKEKPPIPQQLINKITENPGSNPESIKILKKAELLANHVDSFFLPGGEDVPPSLYGQKDEEHTNWGNDYRRSILELGIIHQSFNKGIPLMGICRGFQVSNVYFGAQLLQDVKGEKGIQKFQLVSNEHKGIYYNALKDSILSAVFHHQAVSEEIGPTEHLEPSVVYQNLIKASELKYAGATPMILLQFHPEFYKATTAHNMKREYIDKGLEISMSESNEVFWDILSDSIKAYRIKKDVLETITLSETERKRTRGIENLEEERAKAFEIFKSKYYSERKAFLQEIINAPERARRYLQPPEVRESRPILEEEDIILAALRRNEDFSKQLGREKLNRLMSIIEEVNPELHKELTSIEHLNLK